MKLASTAVYTTIAPERVLSADRGDEPSEPLFEKKRWVSASKELEKARKNGERFAIFMSDARDCSELLFWGVVEDLKVTDEGTHFTFSHLKGLRDCFTQDLVLASEKRPIAPGFIRPYAMVLPPDFLDEATMDAERRLAEYESEGDDVTVDADARELVREVKISDDEEATYFLDDDGDLARLPQVRRRGHQPAKIAQLGMESGDGFILELDRTDDGIGVYKTPIVSAPPARPQSVEKVARPKKSSPAEQAPAPSMPTLFSWGYEGWGSSLPQLLALTAAAEAARGHGPPVFVDVRFSRSVRAPGFRDRAFEQALPEDRYRWMKGLGNAGIGDGGATRIHRPADGAELLDLALAEHARKRRIIFFCSCGWLEGCHRNEVRNLVLGEARRRKLAIEISEWPGCDAEKTSACSLTLSAKELSRVLDGASRIPITEELAITTLAALPWGSYVDLTDGARHTTIAASATRFSAGKWFIEPFLRPVIEDATIGDLAKDLARLRKQTGHARFSSM